MPVRQIPPSQTNQREIRLLAPGGLQGVEFRELFMRPFAPCFAPTSKGPAGIPSEHRFLPRHLFFPNTTCRIGYGVRSVLVAFHEELWDE
jgi:hypothetical protein